MQRIEKVYNTGVLADQVDFELDVVMQVHAHRFEFIAIDCGDLSDPGTSEEVYQFIHDFQLRHNHGNLTRVRKDSRCQVGREGEIL